MRFLLLCILSLGLLSSTLAQQADFNLRYGGHFGTSGNIAQPARQVSAAGWYSLALMQDSSVVAWGLGNLGTTRVPEDLRSVVQISAGYSLALALKADSTVAWWGTYNPPPAGLARVVAVSAGYFHGLALTADSTIVSWSNYPYYTYSVPAGLRHVVAISAGGYHNLALLADSTVAAWGKNDSAQATVPAGLRGVVAIAAGANHSLALKADGTVVAWGDNTFGQASVPAGLSGIVAISTSNNFNLALKANGTAVLWGNDGFGHGQAVAGLSDIKSLAAGSEHTLALKADGSIMAVGSNSNGQCMLPRGLSRIRQVSLSPSFTLALRADGRVVGWGNNAAGQITIPPGLPPAKAVAAGSFFSLVLLDDGTVAAWGDNYYGQTRVPAGLRDVTAVVAGSAHALALKANGTVVGWGSNIYGETTIPAGLSGVVGLAAYNSHSLAVKSNGTVVGWGNNADGQTTIPPGLSNVVALATGTSHVLALKSDSTVVAWGGNQSGQTNVPFGLNKVVGIAAGHGYSVALKANGSLVWWGYTNNLPQNLQNIRAIAAAYETFVAIVGPDYPGQEPRRLVLGQAFAAGNGNCVPDAGERPIRYQAVSAFDTASGKRFYALSDTAGQYRLAVDSGRYGVETLLRTDQGLLQRQVCPAPGTSIGADLTGSRDTVSDINFALDEQVCPRLELQLGANRRRRCAANYTLLSYGNTGLAPQAGVVVHVRMPRYVSLLGASQAYTFTADSVYHFELGTLQARQTGQIYIRDSVACLPGLMGVEACTQAWMTPLPGPCSYPQGYDGSLVLAEGECQGSYPVVKLKNLGQAMAVPRRFRVYLDTALAYEDTYRLAAGDSLLLPFPDVAWNQAVTVLVEQDSLSPTGRWQVGFASCNRLTRYGGPNSQGVLPASPSPITARDCQPIRDSYDPNDKQVEPLGIGPEGKVEPGTWLRYRIRFMNKGNDTAYTVRIVDTLSPLLDLATLKFGPSSHAYTPSLSGQGKPVLTLRFANLRLPDSTRSGAVAAQGFVDFSIRALADAPLGSQVLNQASIYFDFNEAVKTNTVVNTLYRPVLQPGLIDSVLTAGRPMAAQSLKARPNPSTGQLEGETPAAGRLEVVSADGRLAYATLLKAGQNRLNLAALPQGLYLLRLNGAALRWVRE